MPAVLKYPEVNLAAQSSEECAQRYVRVIQPEGEAAQLDGPSPYQTFRIRCQYPCCFAMASRAITRDEPWPEKYLWKGPPFSPR